MADSSKPQISKQKSKLDQETIESLPMKLIVPGEVKTTMKDIGGYEEAKLEVIEFVNFLKHRERYEKLGARLPRGILLHGEPGTGKTLLARATAGEANIPFLTCAAASFLGKDSGPTQLKQVFKVASSYAPCVLYFDEIDCIGQSRESSWSRTPVPDLISLTEELLVQLDGFETDRDTTVLIFGSTNSIHSIDSALLRPGRFDRTIKMSAPNTTARISIFDVHMRPLVTKMDKDKLCSRLALLSNSFTGAQIASTCNEAAMIAARDENDHIHMEHFEQALDRVRSGLRLKEKLSSLYKPLAAYHEAAHAIIGWFLPGVHPPTKLSIIPKSDSSGRACSQGSIKEAPSATLDAIEKQLAILTAGRVAERMCLPEANKNASSASAKDLDEATQLAILTVVAYGLGTTFGDMSCRHSFLASPFSCGDSLKLLLGSEEKDQSFKEVKKLIFKGSELAKDVLEQHKELLDKLSNALIEKDTLSFDEMEDILGKSPISLMDLCRKEDSQLPSGLRDWDD